MADENLSFPFRDLVGFTVDTHADGATAAVEVGSQHLNPHGVLHGGVAFTLIDTAMGAAAQAAVDDGLWCTTIDIHTRFLRPVTAGRRYVLLSFMFDEDSRQKNARFRREPSPASPGP